MEVKSFTTAVGLFFFFFNDTATTEIYTLSLHDALPIRGRGRRCAAPHARRGGPRLRRPPTRRRRRRGRARPLLPGAARRLQVPPPGHDRARAAPERRRKDRQVEPPRPALSARTGGS